MTPAIDEISDSLIRQGVRAAIERTLIPARAHPAYPGHFCVTADGSHFGTDVTWPGLDSWEMAGAYLLMGDQQIVLDYFSFVRASQRHDGNIPFAIFCADKPVEGTDTYLRGMRYPRDVYVHAPPNSPARRWIGLFDHWQINVNPLSVLAPICYVLTAGEIVESMPPVSWLRNHLASIESAGRYILSRKGENGLIGGAGFYIECPPRNQFDGITQCYAILALRTLSKLVHAAGEPERAADWARHAEELRQQFLSTFWVGDHFAEYVHPERGVVDLRLTDVNFAAIGLDIASDDQARQLWPWLIRETGFWIGDMPTQLVAQPAVYEEWEWPEALPFHHVNGPVYDVAAMGRVWYLDALACIRMKDWGRLTESVHLVCKLGERHGWQWHERYHATAEGRVSPAGPRGYCEYAAVLVRIVLGNLRQFA